MSGHCHLEVHSTRLWCEQGWSYVVEGVCSGTWNGLKLFLNAFSRLRVNKMKRLGSTLCFIFHFSVRVCLLNNWYPPLFFFFFLLLLLLLPVIPGPMLFVTHVFRLRRGVWLKGRKQKVREIRSSKSKNTVVLRSRRCANVCEAAGSHECFSRTKHYRSTLLSASFLK